MSVHRIMGIETEFGISAPDEPNANPVILSSQVVNAYGVDVMPNRVYKYNGDDWIVVDKNLSDNYTYDVAYIDHLIAKIASGEYDPELLSEGEKEQVAQRLKNTPIAWNQMKI